MAISSGVARSFLIIMSQFIKEFASESIATGSIVLNSQLNPRQQLETLSNTMLTPVVERFFSNGVLESNKLFQREVLRYVDMVNTPFRYDRSLLDSLNENSVFQGFYDRDYKQEFSSKEITRIKKSILRAKYTGQTDRELAAQLRADVNLTKNRSLVLARMETQRLEFGAQDALYQQPGVKENWMKVYSALSDARPTHQSLDGQVADDDGYFTDWEGRKFLYPAPPSDPFGCRCKSVLKKRS